MPLLPKFVPRQRKQKNRQRSSAHENGNAATTDSNAVELLPAPEAEKKARKIRNALLAEQPLSKVSSKKKKRLDKYIVCVLQHDVFMANY